MPLLGISPPEAFGCEKCFLTKMVCFRSKFLQNLEVFSLQTPEDLVLEWFRRRNGPDDQEKSASIDPKSSTKAHVRSRQRFLGVWSVPNAPRLRILGVWSVLGSPQVGLPTRFRCGGSVFDRNFSQRKTPRRVCFLIEFREICAKGNGWLGGPRHR